MNDSQRYTHNFYASRHARSVDSARVILERVLGYLPPVYSVVDYGCGVGTWLATARALGVGELYGYEGCWLDPALLEIESDCFEHVEFSERLDPTRFPRADLAISLEVAEHLPETRAEDFVELLTHNTDFVLFSAAIPDQGGKNHSNEQWPDYWIERFEDRGFKTFDVIRPAIWDDARIRPWYRQNTFLMARRSRIADTALAGAPPPAMPRALVHPEVFAAALASEREKTRWYASTGGAWKTLRRALATRRRGKRDSA